MAFSPTHVSNNVLKRSFDENVEVTPMKLQKILYFLAAEYGKEAKEKYLFDQMFQPWRYGPVLPSIYDEFRAYGSGRITRYAKDAQGESRIVRESDNPTFQRVLDRVWKATRSLDAINLSALTHAEGSAWYQAWMERARYLDEDAVINDKTYQKLLSL